MFIYFYHSRIQSYTRNLILPIRISKSGIQSAKSNILTKFNNFRIRNYQIQHYEIKSNLMVNGQGYFIC